MKIINSKQRCITRREFLKKLSTGALSLIGLFSIFNPIALFARRATKITKPEDLKFAFVADGHWNLEGVWTHVMHNTLVKSLNSQDLDLVTFAGDSFNNNSDSFSDAKKYKKVTNKIRHPLYYILGNKESTPTPKTDPLNKDDFKKMFFPKDVISYGYNWKKEIGNYVILGLDSSINNSTKGELSPQTLDFVENQLKKEPDKYHILVMHHLLRQLGEDDPEWLIKRNTIQNFKTVIPRLCKYKNLRLWLCAHQHEQKTWYEGHVRVISAPGYVVPPHTYTVISMKNGDITEEKFIDLADQVLDTVTSASSKAKGFKHYDLEFNNDGFNKKEILIPRMVQVRIDLMNNSNRNCRIIAKDLGINLLVKTGTNAHFEFTADKTAKYLYKSPEINSSGYFIIN